MKPLTLTAAALVSAAMLAAQGPFEPNIGTALGAGDDTLSGPLALGFSFPAPGGVAVTDVEADSNGRVVQTGTDASDFSESVGELLGNPGFSICPYWDDLSFTTAASDDLYFNALPGKAVITWNDVTQFSGADPFTMQVQLFPDGRIIIFYDGRTLNDEPIVGLSAGNGAADPGESDLTAGLSTLVPDIYEDFNFDCDFDSGWFEFVPNAGGGYDVTFTALALATVVPGRTGCVETSFSMTLTPNGSGGYDSTIGGSFDTNFATGTALGLGDDSLSGALALGFTFPAPGGVNATDIEVDSNGRVIQTGTDGSDFSESISELLNNPGWSICPLWNDMNPSAGGEVWFLDNGTDASVTWDGAPQFGQTNAPVFQARLFADGSVQFHYRSMAELVQTNTIVGVSAGNGVADPGEVDFTDPSSSGSVAALYEFFDVLGGDTLGFAKDRPELVANALPVIGANFEMAMVNVPAGTTQDFYLYGVAISQDLGALGIGLDGCFLLSDGLVLTAFYPTGTASVIPIPNDANLAGLEIEIQGATFSPGFNPAGVAFTDSVTATLGF